MDTNNRKAFIRALGKFRYNSSLMNAVITNDSPTAAISDIINHETIVGFRDVVEKIDSTAVKINGISYRFFNVNESSFGRSLFIYDNDKLLTLDQFLNF